MKQVIVYDVLVLGSGIAGLSLANYLLDQQHAKSSHQKLSILVISKGKINDTNTAWAQGGVAAVIDENDSIERHINDTLNAGAYVNDPVITRKIIGFAPQAIQDLISWGVTFDRNSNGEFDLGLEGGHDHPRILHHQDITGAVIQQSIQDYYLRNGGEIMNHMAAVDVVKTTEGFHVTLFDIKDQVTIEIFCAHLVIATGGLGQLFTRTTNTIFSTGDGIYLSHRLGASIKDLSMVQFHPTGLYVKDGPPFLISEALRGAGAELLDHEHVPFMQRYDQRASLAPRDIVSRAIWQEMQLSQKDYVWLDVRKIPKDILSKHFSNIVSNCISRSGVDPAKDLIPVSPIQHYSCGGIVTDGDGATNISGLYAIGECAYTGLHGANRLASNSLLEGICMARFAADQIGLSSPIRKMEVEFSSSALPSVLKLDINFIKEIFSQAAGVVRRKVKMREALVKLETIGSVKKQIPFNIQDFENTVMLQVSILLLRDALARESSIGVHYVEV